jgi:predicted CXXCH cytochrome family protein
MQPLSTLLNNPRFQAWRWLIFVILLLLPLSNNSVAQIKTPSNPNSAKACAICHYRWIDTFFIQGKGTDLVSYQSEKVVATAQMCYSCHDGSVQDSRRKADKNLIHKVNAPVPGRMRIPEQFPLGKDNSLQCATCHTPHALPGTGADGETIFMRASLKDSAMCLMCHTDKVHLLTSKHNLLRSAPAEKNREGQTAADTGPCSACHLQHAAARNLSQKKDYSSQLCITCHSQGNVAAGSQLKDNQHPLHIRARVNGDALALPLFDTGGVRQANGLIACATCHDAHRWDPGAAEGDISAVVKANRTNSFLRKPAPHLCGDCHPDKAFIEKTDHDLSVTAPESLNALAQNPNRSGLCGVCHLVHNSRNDVLLWARGFGPGNNIMEMMCNACHWKAGTAGEKTPAVYFHPREKLIRIEGRQNVFPLFNAASGKPAMEGNLSCPSCHNAHQWNPEIPSRGNGQNLEGSLADSFLRPRADFDLCAQCHPKDAASKLEFYHDATKRRYKSFDQQFFH